MQIKNPKRAWETIVELVMDDTDLTVDELNEELRAFGVDIEALDAEIKRLTPLLEAKWQELKRGASMKCPFNCRECRIHESRDDQKHCASCINCGREWMKANLERDENEG